MADFRARLPLWLKRAGGAVNGPGAIDIGDAYNPHGARKYMLKGLDPAYAALYRIDVRPQGEIYGKRLGFSASLAPSQCKEHGTKKRWHPPQPGMLPYQHPMLQPR